MADYSLSQWISIRGIRGARYITKPNTAWHRNIWWTGRDPVYLLHSTLLFIILHTQSIVGPTVYLCKRCGIVSEFGARNWSICRRRIPRIYTLNIYLFFGFFRVNFQEGDVLGRGGGLERTAYSYKSSQIYIFSPKVSDWLFSSAMVCKSQWEHDK